jgi:glycosyltransferase involved in cell wall biosynthesis
MSTASPRVTIGLPIYNGAKYLKPAIESVLNQTLSDFILHISDNASTDETKDICQTYQATDARIKYVRHQENIGPVANFSWLLDQTQTPYFMWLAHDDRIESTFLEQAVSALEQNLNATLAFSDYSIQNLETLEQTAVSVTPAVDDSAFVRCAKQLLRPCPSMIYGMQRTMVAKSIPLHPFDFADLHYVVCTALAGKILKLDKPLYIAGVKGQRIPYSLLGGKIKRWPFIKEQARMFYKNMNTVNASMLILISCAFMLQSKIRMRIG